MKSSGVHGEKSVTRGSDAQRVGRQPVAERAVADLVVVLRAHDQPPRIVARPLKIFGEPRAPSRSPA